MTETKGIKQEYEAPRLTRIGDVKDLTKGDTGRISDAAGSMNP
jgi:hypothetical protein